MNRMCLVSAIAASLSFVPIAVAQQNSSQSSVARTVSHGDTASVDSAGSSDTAAAPKSSSQKAHKKSKQTAHKKTSTPAAKPNSTSKPSSTPQQ